MNSGSEAQEMMPTSPLTFGIEEEAQDRITEGRREGVTNGAGAADTYSAEDPTGTAHIVEIPVTNLPIATEPISVRQSSVRILRNIRTLILAIFATQRWRSLCSTVESLVEIPVTNLLIAKESSVRTLRNIRTLILAIFATQRWRSLCSTVESLVEKVMPYLIAAIRVWVIVWASCLFYTIYRESLLDCVLFFVAIFPFLPFEFDSLGRNKAGEAFWLFLSTGFWTVWLIFTTNKKVVFHAGIAIYPVIWIAWLVSLFVSLYNGRHEGDVESGT